MRSHWPIWYDKYAFWTFLPLNFKSLTKEVCCIIFQENNFLWEKNFKRPVLSLNFAMYLISWTTTTVSYLNSLVRGGSLLLKISSLAFLFKSETALVRKLWINSIYLLKGLVKRCIAALHFSVELMVSFFVLLNPLLVKPMHCKKACLGDFF